MSITASISKARKSNPFLALCLPWSFGNLQKFRKFPQCPFMRDYPRTSLQIAQMAPASLAWGSAATSLAGEQCQIVRRKQFFLLENRRGRGEWGLFPPPTDPKIIEIWLNLRFISSEVRLLVGKTPGVDLIVLLATGRGAPKQRKLVL